MSRLDTEVRADGGMDESYYQR